MNILVLKIKKDNSTGAKLNEIEKYLKTEFKSLDYALGFFDGYLFDNYSITELDKFEKALNMGNDYFEKYYIKFIKINESLEG